MNNIDRRQSEDNTVNIGIPVENNLQRQNEQSVIRAEENNENNELESANSLNSGTLNDGGKTLFDKRLKKMGIGFMGIFVMGIIATLNFHSSKGVYISDDVQAAIEQHVSTSLEIGSKLMYSDENTTPQDYTITHSQTADSTKIWVWDYAAEDGDYVQILVGGIALGDPFMIKNKPIELEVPAVGDIQVVGTHDGGGGITYAINYELNGTSYFNGTDVGKNNTYTLIRE